MAQQSRVYKSFLNAKANLIFYFINLLISFFSRKIFLDTLSADFIGLTSTLNGFLSFLNLAELGISTAIGYVLYKPIFEENHKKINEIISVFGYLYRIIGFIILGVGIILSLFFPLIFEKSNYSFPIIYFTFYSFLTSSLLGYFVNYKQTLLGADQKNYVVTTYFQTTNIICYILQTILVFYTQNPYLWITINLSTSIIYCIILNWRIRKVYPWLQTDIKLGKNVFKQYPEVTKYTKQLFIHRIASFVQYQATPTLLYAFDSLKIVAYYGNYTIITDKLSILINNFLGGTYAGVGNLIAENDKEKIIKVFWELYAIRFFVSGICIFSIYHLINPFIILWLGKEYLLSSLIITLILINFFISQTRGATDQFLYGFGLFSDIWAPFVEICISLIISIILGNIIGIPGVLMGNIISMIIIVGIWKPYFLFHKGFKISVLIYWKSVFVYILCLTISFVIGNISLSYLHISPTHNYATWILYGGITVCLYTTIYATLLYIFTQGMRDLIKRGYKLIIK